MRRFTPQPHTSALTAIGICMLLLPESLHAIRWNHLLSVYFLPLAFAALVVMFVVWRLHREDLEELTTELKRTKGLAEQRERERDLAQEEVFRRLYEERELNKEKIQFQAKLAEYEKYAALAQLALGAAHEINNPLASIAWCASACR